MGLVCHDDFNRSSIYYCLLLAVNNNEKSTQSVKEAVMNLLICPTDNLEIGL